MVLFVYRTRKTEARVCRVRSAHYSCILKLEVQSKGEQNIACILLPTSGRWKVRSSKACWGVPVVPFESRDEHTHAANVMIITMLSNEVARIPDRNIS